MSDEFRKQLIDRMVSGGRVSREQAVGFAEFIDRQKSLENACSPHDFRSTAHHPGVVALDEISKADGDDT